MAGGEPKARRSGQFPRRLCLNHIRQLARLLNAPSGNEKIGADLKAKQSVTGTCKFGTVKLLL